MRVSVDAETGPAEAVPLHEEVYAELRRRLITGRIVPGVGLSTRGLAEELGVSQMPVREALSRLAADGAVEIRSKKRAQVTPMSPQRFDDLLALPAAARAGLGPPGASSHRQGSSGPPAPLGQPNGGGAQGRRRQRVYGRQLPLPFHPLCRPSRHPAEPADRDLVAAVRPLHAGGLWPFRHLQSGRPASCWRWRPSKRTTKTLWPPPSTRISPTGWG